MRFCQALGKVKGRGRIYSVGKVWLGRILEEIAVFVKFPESGGHPRFGVGTVWQGISASGG